MKPTCRSVKNAITTSRARISILVVTTPPLIRRALRPALGRFFPLFLASVRHEIQERPGAAQRLGAPVGREVGAEDLVAVAQEYAVAVSLLVGGGEPEILIERAPSGGDPPPLPAHALAILLDVLERRSRHHGKRYAARANMNRRELSDVVERHGAARTTGRGPAIDARSKHEVIEEELRALFEQIEQRDIAAAIVEAVALLHARHRQYPPLRCAPVPCTPELLLLDEQRLSRDLPFRRRNDSGKGLDIR